MNVSVPGSGHLPHHHHHHPHNPKENLVERLKAIFKSAKLLANDVRIIWTVIEFMKNPKTKNLNAKLLAI